ncbi:MAG: glycogen synthase GlgA [Pseudomonadota bacterium]
MRVLMVTPEATPFGQTGGLGEVLSALPAALVRLGLEVDVLMPKYRGITPDRYPIEKLDLGVEVDLNAAPVTAGLWAMKSPRGVRYIFLENDAYYDRDGLYGTLEGDYPDNCERFVFLARAAIEMCLNSGIRYDVFHAHDWQAALVPVYTRTLFAGEKVLDGSASVLTIHNLGFQGIFWHLDMPIVGVGWEYFNPNQMEFYGKLNFLKSGIVFADRVNTVSPGYCEEIKTPEFGFGLEGLLLAKGESLTGILNGVDYTVWDPATDPAIKAPFTPEDLSGKAECKRAFQIQAGLSQRPDTPILAVISRLSNQKGIDLLEELIPFLVERDVQLVVLGAGETRYHESFRAFGEEHRDRFAVFLEYSPGLAHKIFAASDMILVPSRYEPCGLNQLYGLRYGTVPIVRATGGLNDTVQEYDPERDLGTGFKFFEARPQAFEEAIASAIDLYRGDPSAWQRLMARGMKQDFSWDRSAAEYRKLYEKAVRERSSFQDEG